MKFLKENEDAVSPVIGVILMVAITVILAAVIAAFVFGMAGSIQKTRTVAATAKQVGNFFIVTYHGGADDNEVGYLNVTFLDNGTVFHTTNSAGALSDTSTAFQKPSVGAVLKSHGATSANDHVVVTAHFTDGSENVISESYV
jgi:flagellin-like protein